MSRRGKGRRKAFVDGWMAARAYYGWVDTLVLDGTGDHGAECAKTHNPTYLCTCSPVAQRRYAQEMADEWIDARVRT